MLPVGGILSLHASNWRETPGYRGRIAMASVALSLTENRQTGQQRLQPRAQSKTEYLCDVAGQRPVSFASDNATGERSVYSTKMPGTPSEPRRVTKRSALRLVAQALDATVGDKASPVKHIQKAADVDRSTADSWLKGRSLPSAHHLFNLMIEFPEFYGEIRRIVAMEAELHQDLQRDIAALVQKAMSR